MENLKKISEQSRELKNREKWSMEGSHSEPKRNIQEDSDRALARELQEQLDKEANESVLQRDEMLALMLQQVEKEKMRRLQERRLKTHRLHKFVNSRSIDVDRMSYEELLALEERIGDAKSHGASKEEIRSLPVTIVEEADEDLYRCSICLSDFEKGDTLKTLPCFHKYHLDCIDQWLIKKKTCPVCQKPIIEDS